MTSATQDLAFPAAGALPKIEFQHVRKEFAVRPRPGAKGPQALQTFVALSDVSLAIARGEFLTVVGPSGCGKSTLLDLTAGLTRPDGGRVLLDGVPVTGPALDRAVVFQQYALLPWRTALGNIELSLEAAGVERRQRRDKARTFLDLVGLSAFEDRYPHELSGGMKQRVAIARSLAHDPEVLLMDEPFAALDAQTREILQEELLAIWRRSGTTIVFVTHGIEEAIYLGQRVAVMTSRPGQIKRVVEIPLGEQKDADDPRSSPEFAHLRHKIWTLLHDEVSRAPQGEAA
ncbi:ABC transporter ATP-binding protein [Acidisoma silvae]|uniref:ABC transporter ATP-binding protein n=1 Tax=Acidisoma silvae TaxID=2802396 RepID=A0A964E159_9PROT|nr:ABC transporter ATP-binding protein [Acidisoma silvae]MCB8878011.1 ABC transporter ATP-binding protein [Acidisoma silvae]